MTDLFTFGKKHAPRWLILLIDLLISAGSIIFAYLLRFNFDYDNHHFSAFPNIIYFVLSVRLVLFIATKSYAGIIRYTGTRDAVRIMSVVFLSNIIYSAANIISYYYVTNHFVIPFSIVLIDFFISIFLMTSFRLIVKTLYFEATNYFREENKILILGIGQHALNVKRTLARDLETNYKVVAFIDPSDMYAKKQLDRVTVQKLSSIDKIIEKHKITDIIIAGNGIAPEKKQALISTAFNADVKVKTVPDVSEWINGELSFKQIRSINIADLLERDPIKLDEKKIKSDITNKVILVTGAAGSIGKEIVIQLTKFHSQKIIVLDQAESPLYNLELELLEKVNFRNFEIIIGDVTNKARMKRLFELFKPEIVYHAAAYKHVPMMENNPAEAIKTNVLGTKIIADLSVEYEVKKFVMISTDKAVNPTNVMGASKRIAEIYCQTISENKKTKFITTRFGNVLGSNGSVIPRFRKQIEDGGPVTVTHPEITRYFMTIPEACQLVLQAGALGSGGEIFIFDMGQSVKIVDLAKKMIQLSGYKLGTDINLRFTGLRPGEKLYEELLNDKENTLPTEHEKIMTAKVRKYTPDKIFPEIKKLIDMFPLNDNFEIVKQMKLIVPEFTSKNSVFESLDK